MALVSALEISKWLTGAEEAHARGFGLPACSGEGGKVASRALSPCGITLPGIIHAFLLLYIPFP